MHVTDLAINRALGMQLASEGSGHILEMPESPLLLNHVGTVHASAQFALAEASSGEFLLRHLGDLHGQLFVFFILTVAAAESAIGLAILVVLFRERKSINVEQLDTMKG